MLEVKDLCFSYRRQEILRNINFCLKPGECLVVTGANGCGKSTLLSLLAGVLKPRSGEIRMGQSKVGLVPQGNGIFPDMTVSENIKFFAGLSGVKPPPNLDYGLGPYRNKRAENLSGGYQKRLGIACAMVSVPDVVLLDEPCSGLDLKWRDEVKRLIRELKQEKKAVVLVSHDPEEFQESWDQLLLLGKGKSRLLVREERPVDLQQILREWIEIHSDPMN